MTAPPNFSPEVYASLKFISRAEMLKLIGDVTYPAVWSWIQRGTFPRGREIGRRTMWIEAEVKAWIASRPVRKLKGDDAKKAGA